MQYGISATDYKKNKFILRVIFTSEGDTTIAEVLRVTLSSPGRVCVSQEVLWESLAPLESQQELNATPQRARMLASIQVLRCYLGFHTYYSSMKKALTDEDQFILNNTCISLSTRDIQMYFFFVSCSENLSLTNSLHASWQVVCTK